MPVRRVLPADGILEGLAPLLADPAARVAGLHLYTFNAVEATEAWRAGSWRASSGGATVMTGASVSVSNAS